MERAFGLREDFASPRVRSPHTSRVTSAHTRAADAPQAMTDDAVGAPSEALDEGTHAPTRWRALTKNPRRLIIALALILVAILIAVFATATFTSSSANAGNLVATGDLKVDNSNDGAAILTASGLVPGQSAEGTVTISNTGSAEGNFSLTTTNLTDTPASPPLSGKLDLVIVDTTNATNPNQVYSGKVNAVGTIQLGRWAAGEHHSYKFTATFPNGTPAEDNPYKNSSTSVDFVWNAVT
jgi:spore coat-associated protein N